MEKTIVYNPDKRLSAVEVLGHNYFDEIREKSVYTNIERKIQAGDFFNFNEISEHSFPHPWKSGIVSNHERTGDHRPLLKGTRSR